MAVLKIRKNEKHGVKGDGIQMVLKWFVQKNFILLLFHLDFFQNRAARLWCSV